MYTQFFNFRERPFKLAPDPEYLFFGETHEDAVTHMLYARWQEDGLVKIIGEAGTGKTTICRAFIENTRDEIEVAYIPNPKMDPIQLLKAINVEFQIDSSANNIKDLIDTLNVYLLKTKVRKKSAILLIDEAQNLSAELLEQLRLLSNLETTTDKLLQIIMVGQPGLDDMLDAHNLKQLAQRITLSCYLKHLSRQETRAYIQHRINIAAPTSAVKFSRAAIGSIYRYSLGNPRRINIVTDRVLLAAFGLKKYRINAKMTKTAIRELSLKDHVNSFAYHPGVRPVLILSFLLAVMFFVVSYQLGVSGLFTPSTLALLETSKPAIEPQFKTGNTSIHSVTTRSLKGGQAHQMPLVSPQGSERMSVK